MTGGNDEMGGAVMRVKQVTANIKADGDGAALEEGQFTAYASVFGNIDSYGDVVKAGAFADSLAEWAESGNVIPVYFGHRMDDLEYNIGHVVEAVEDEHGLLVKCQLDLEMTRGALAHRLIKEKRLTQLSFAYDVLEASPVEVDGQKATELHKLRIYEVSVVPIGANQATEFLDVKSLVEDVKAGRVLSQKNIDSLKEARDAIDRVILQAESVDEAKNDPILGVKREEPVGVKREEPPALRVEALRAFIEIATLEGGITF